MLAGVAIVAATVVVVWQLSGSAAAAAAASGAAPATMMEHCRNARCGDMEVPYPFGITPGCSYPAPGFNLTCDTSHAPPRLLLGDGTPVLAIYPSSSILTVNSTGAVRISRGSGSVGLGKWAAPGFEKYSSFVLADGGFNELVVAGCNVVATLRDTNGTIFSTCSSLCSRLDHDKGAPIVFGSAAQSSYNDTTFCFGEGCCQNVIPFGSPLFEVRSQPIDDVNDSSDSTVPSYIFVAQSGWYNDEIHYALYEPTWEQGRWYAETLVVPVMLRWIVRPSKCLPPPDDKAPPKCPDNVSSEICKSKHSGHYAFDNRDNIILQPGGYACFCHLGYDGNPYIPGGCQDVDECKMTELQLHKCFGECSNTDGSFKCQCPQGTQGNPKQPGGCVPVPIPAKSISKGLIVGIAVGSGAGSIILVLIAIFMTQRFKNFRAIKLKQKHFKQNRGQLLEQLVSQNADIAERMIIPVDELAKATNNFDKARELGGGGHGTVYKGILLDQHVVAIKKSKITVQREIDEFINEVAILSQINHRNVVKLFGCCLETEVPLLVYEFVPNGTLYEHLHVEGSRSLSWGTRLRIATETSSALAYLHSSVSTPIIHRDIKSSNILLDDTFTSKVSDFGASKYIPIDKTSLTTWVQGTIGYLDPMYFYTGRLTEKSDVYSFGVMLVELLTRKKPFSYLHEEGLVSHFVSLLDEDNLAQILDPQIIEEGGKEVKEVSILAASCIKLTAENRPVMQQVELALKGIAAKRIQENGIPVMNCASTEEGQRRKESSRRYSMEQEFLLSASYPR
ncbi:hypothetical protein ACP4OV_031649 [Aristida adscensionis]